MKKLLKPVLITIIILGALTGGAFYLLNRGNGETGTIARHIADEQSDQTSDRAFRHEMIKTAVELKLTGENKNVLNFDKDHAYQVSTSTAARERLDRVIRKKNVSFEEPLIAANPFGTNENSFYFYFTTDYKGMVRYTITVEDESVPDHIRYVDNGQEKNLTKRHECIVSGLIPGMTNFIIMEVLDNSGNSHDKKIFQYTPPAAKLSSKISAEQGKSKELCKNGLFFLFPKSEKDIYVYDNSGMLRDIILTESGHGKRLYQLGDSVIYQVSDKKVAKVSALGRVTGVTEVKGYSAIRDFAYDGYDNIYCLVTKKKREYLVSASFSTGKTKMIYAFAKGMSVNSLTIAADGAVYLSCDKPGGILRMEAVTSNRPEVSFVLGVKEQWKKIVKADKSLKKKVKEDKTVVHWNVSGTVLNGNDIASAGTKDVFSTYLFDHDKGTGVSFTIDHKDKKVDVSASLPTNQSGDIQGLAYGEHFVIADMSQGNYSEYDKQGKVVKEYKPGVSLDGMTKLSLDGMCFYGAE